MPITSDAVAPVKTGEISPYENMIAAAIAYLNFREDTKEAFVPLEEAISNASNGDPHVPVTADSLPEEWKKDEEKDQEKGREVKVIDKDISQAVILRDKKNENVIVSFRGTRPEEINDWKEDLKFLPHDFVAASGKSFKVAQGFLETEENIHAEVAGALEEIINKNPAANIYITGHSLGAAAALLYAMNPGGKIKPHIKGVCVFAPPIVGDGTCAEEIDNLENCTLVGFLHDPVLGLPLPGISLPEMPGGYVAPKRYTILKENGEIDSNAPPITSRAELENLLNPLHCIEHLPVNYLGILANNPFLSPRFISSQGIEGQSGWLDYIATTRGFGDRLAAIIHGQSNTRLR